MKYIINLFFIFFFLTNSPSHSKEIYQPNIPNKLKIELDNSENRKFITNFLKAALDDSELGKNFIKQKYKKWHSGNLIVNDNGEIKTYKIKIRIMGDYKDHIDIEHSRASLKIKLIDKTLNGIKRFRLFLPNTRDDTNEVFINLLLKYVGFPTLYTKIVNTNFLDQNYRAIFQEEGSKEFLERNGFYEVPIIKTGEYQFALNKTSQNRDKLVHSYIVNNSGIIKKDNSDKAINDAIYIARSKNFKKLIFNNQFFEKILTYLGGTEPHGLIKFNRKYIYLPLNRIFIPLYYDGNINYMNVEKDKCKKSFDTLAYQKFKLEYKTLSQKEISFVESCIFDQIYSEYLEKYKNQKNFFDYLPLKNNEILLNNKIQFVKKIINNYETKGENLYKDEFKFLDKYFYQNNNNYNKCYFSELEKVFTFCKKIAASEYKKILHTRPKIDNFKNFQTTSINIGSSDLNNSIKFLNKEEISNNKIYLEDPITYYLKLNKIKNKKKIIFKNNKSRLILFGNADNLDLSFYSKINNSYNLKTLNERTNNQLITGCITFYNANFKNIQLYFDNLFCEDAVNFLYSKGDIKKIQINNSLSDALDADFSELSIKNLVVNISKNDCSDFSFGKYSILNATLKNCGDKAFSFGEMSRGNINNIKIENSYDGIVSKDSSIVNASNIYTKKILNNCLASYNKKPEFSGGSLFVKNFQCDGPSYKDSISKIYYNE